MTLFDTLGQLETYIPVFPDMAHVVSVMDRSLPYDNKDGSYKCPECERVGYTVQSALTSTHGFPFTVREGEKALLIALDGQEIVSSLDSKSVFVLCEGRFVLLGPGDWKRGVATDLPSPFRDVIFHF